MTERTPLIEFRTHELFNQGAPPDGSTTWPEFAEKIPLYESVNKDLLLEGDEKPFYVVLDIAKVGAISENGLVYDDDLVNVIEQQLPGSGGIRGHIPPEADSYAFPIDEFDWVGHVRLGGVTYGKTYIPPGETREFIRRLIARGGKLRTSIRGECVRESIDSKKRTWRAKEFKLEGLDLAPATKAALRKYLTGRATIANETINKGVESMGEVITMADVPQDVREQIVRQSEVAAKAERVTELESRVSEMDAQVKELTQYKSIVLEIRRTIGKDSDTAAAVAEYYNAGSKLAEMLGVDFANVTVTVQEMHEAIKEYKKAAFENAVDTQIAELTKWNPTTDDGKKRVASFRSTLKRAVLGELKGEQAPEKIAETAKALWDGEYQPLAELIVKELAGPSAFVPGRDKPVGNLNKPGRMTDEEREAEAKRFVKS